MDTEYEYEIWSKNQHSLDQSLSTCLLYVDAREWWFFCLSRHTKFSWSKAGRTSSITPRKKKSLHPFESAQQINHLKALPYQNIWMLCSVKRVLNFYHPFSSPTFIQLIGINWNCFCAEMLMRWMLSFSVSSHSPLLHSNTHKINQLRDWELNM